MREITQTRDGYLWFGTRDGLVRFDGLSFVTFTPANTPALLTSDIQYVHAGASGALWVATSGGGLVRYLEGRFTSYTTRDGLPTDLLGDLWEDEEGALWIATSDQGLLRWKEGRVQQWSTADGLPSPSLFAVVPGRGGELWIGGDGGLARMKEGRITRFGAPSGLRGRAVYDVKEDRQGRLWVATDLGVSLFANGRFHNLPGLDRRVDSLLEDREGNLWLGSHGGLFRLRAGAPGARPPLEAFTAAQGLSDDAVYVLFEDEEGSLWIGTRTGGLHRLKDGRFVSYSRAEGLPALPAWALRGDAAGRVWIGSDGGLTLLDHGRTRTYTTSDGLVHDVVRAVLVDRTGAVWAGTTHGLSRWQDGRFTTYTMREGLPHDFVRALAEGRDGAIWVGTWSGGLARLAGGRITRYGAAEGLPDLWLRALLVDGAGVVWVGTRRGLARLEGHRFRTLSKADGLPDDSVLWLHEGGDGRLWVGTRGGLAVHRHGRLRALASVNGLPGDVICAVLEDGAGQVWISSNGGVSRIALSEIEDVMAGRSALVHPVVYGRADGLASAECGASGHPAAFRGTDGRLWFATAAAVAVVDPAHLDPNPRPPRVRLEELLADRRRVPLQAVPTVAPGRGELLFRYTGLSLRSPEKVRFKYRLEGLEEDWVDAGTRREARYTNVAPGQYVFLVAAANEDGVWSPEPAALRFRLRPHFYQTGAFRLLVALSLAALGVGAYRMRVRSLRRRQAELKRLVDDRTRDLVEAVRVKDEVVSIVAHDFRSPLTAIVGYGEMLEARAPDTEARQMAAVIVKRATQLASLAEETLTMSRIDTGNFPVERAPMDLLALVRETVAGHFSGHDVQVETSRESLPLLGDSMRLQQVLDNLIGNAIKYSPPGARVTVALHTTADSDLRLSVTDKGIGIPPADLPRLFQRFGRLPGALDRKIAGTGLGLYICRSIVEAHGGRIWAESRPGEGSTFHVALPATGASPVRS